MAVTRNAPLRLPKFRASVADGYRYPTLLNLNGPLLDYDWKGRPVASGRLAEYPLLWTKEFLQEVTDGLAVQIGLSPGDLPVTVHQEPSIPYGTVGTAIRYPRVLMIVNPDTANVAALLAAFGADLQDAGITVLSPVVHLTFPIEGILPAAVEPYPVTTNNADIWDFSGQQFLGGELYVIDALGWSFSDGFLEVFSSSNTGPAYATDLCARVVAGGVPDRFVAFGRHLVFRVADTTYAAVTGEVDAAFDACQAGLATFGADSTIELRVEGSPYTLDPAAYVSIFEPKIRAFFDL